MAVHIFKKRITKCVAKLKTRELLDQYSIYLFLNIFVKSQRRFIKRVAMTIVKKILIIFLLNCDRSMNFDKTFWQNVGYIYLFIQSTQALKCHVDLSCPWRLIWIYSPSIPIDYRSFRFKTVRNLSETHRISTSA